jgi:hypothetical protein
VIQVVGRLPSKHEDVSSNPVLSKETPNNQKATTIKKKNNQGMMVHACNPSYSGGEDGEDHSLRPDWAKS